MTNYSKIYKNTLEALKDIPDNASIMIDGFGAGPGGTPQNLIKGLMEIGSKNLTIIGNTERITMATGIGIKEGSNDIDISILIDNKQVKKIIASYPVAPSPSILTSFEKAFNENEIELELVPQGTLAERIRAGGAGIPAFYTPTGVKTELANNKESRIINNKEYILEYALKADYALLKSHKSDKIGNLIYKGTSRNFNAVMASAANITIVESEIILETGEIDPHHIHTPAIYINRIVKSNE